MELEDIKTELKKAGYDLTDEEIQQVAEALGTVRGCVKQLVEENLRENTNKLNRLIRAMENI